MLQNGEVWAWQAKYLFDFDASAAAQVTASVRRALTQEPSLKRYFVTLPLDMPAGDAENRSSAYTRWTAKVAEWEALARANGLDVEFTFVGAHRLLSILTEPAHAGRVRYWFDADVWTPEWQARRLEEVITKAGRRYTARLNVEVDTVQALDAVGRVEDYVARWQHVLAEVRRARPWPWRAPETVADEFGDSLPQCATALDEADTALALLIAAVRSNDEIPRIETVLGAAADAILRVHTLLRQHSLTRDGYYVGEAASLYSYARNALSAIRSGEQLAQAAITRAARDKALLLTGRAGVGKTHLLCDVATQRTAEGRPTVLLLGQDFDNRSLLTQINELMHLGGSVDDLLALLDAAAEGADCIGLLMIDALNESEQPQRWQDDSRALIAAAARYPHVAVVLSCRSEFVEAVVEDGLVPTVEHVGFAEKTDLAVQRFTQEFGLEPPTFPVLNPEFGNPLFLKLTCEALTTLGATRFPLGAAGLTTVCNAFLEAVNKRLSDPGRGDYDEHTDPVGRAVREIALLGNGALDRADVQRTTEQLLPGRPWSRSLLRGLIAEGVLMEVGDGRITFGYQRLGDMTRAAAIAEESPDDVRAWLQGLGNAVWRERGIFGALAVIVPERYGIELIDLALDHDGKASYDVIDSFLESLLLRSPESITPRAVEIAEGLLDGNHRAYEIWDRLIRIACVPGHPLNAEWLHGRLASLDIAERDSTWSGWLVGAVDLDEEHAVRRLIDWAWPADLRNRSAVPEDVAVLAAQVLAWMLTTSDRRVRDQATKAIVSLAERAPAAFARAVRRFRGTNDPYVVERLAAAACGVVLRTHDADSAHLIADAVQELVAGEWPLHLVTRDFVRRVFGVARTSGWAGPAGLPPYGAEWPISTRRFETIESLAGPPGYAYGSIWHSLSGMGDFGRYVMQPALRDIVAPDAIALQHDIERAVFDRVLELGWTPERFSEIDRGRQGGHDGVIERVGKKCQWIGFNEVLGRIADHFEIKPSWSDQEPRPYEYAEQLIWRDIDPTVLVRKRTAASASEPPWFAPVEARFPPAVVDEYPADMTGIPDPLDLIAVSDTDGTPWLVLASAPDWKQPLPPEVEALRVPRRAVWMQLHGYLVPNAEAAGLCDWAAEKDWFGRWMPEMGDAHNVLLGAHPEAPEWSAADGTVNWEEMRAGSPQPAELLHCAAWYASTGTSRDASAEDETRGYVPSRRLLDVIGLSRGVDFTWADPSGIAVWDPSVVFGGPSALVMRRDLVSRLADAEMSIFWTVLIGNELHRSDYGVPGDDYRWVSASASYILRGDHVEQVGATAARYRPGPTLEHSVGWGLRQAEN